MWNHLILVQQQISDETLQLQLKTLVYNQLTPTRSIILSLLCFDSSPPSSHPPHTLSDTRSLPFPWDKPGLLLNCLVMWPVSPRLAVWLIWLTAAPPNCRFTRQADEVLAVMSHSLQSLSQIKQMSVTVNWLNCWFIDCFMRFLQRNNVYLVLLLEKKLPH